METCRFVFLWNSLFVEPTCWWVMEWGSFHKLCHGEHLNHCHTHLFVLFGHFPTSRRSLSCTHHLSLCLSYGRDRKRSSDLTHTWVSYRGALNGRSVVAVLALTITLVLQWWLTDSDRIGSSTNSIETKSMGRVTKNTRQGARPSRGCATRKADAFAPLDECSSYPGFLQYYTFNNSTSFCRFLAEIFPWFLGGWAGFLLGLRISTVPTLSSRVTRAAWNFACKKFISFADRSSVLV